MLLDFAFAAAKLAAIPCIRFQKCPLPLGYRSLIAMISHIQTVVRATLLMMSPGTSLLNASL
jgi:hypothetical protein